MVVILVTSTDTVLSSASWHAHRASTRKDTFYHVINRGNERRAIFRDNVDREGFLCRLGRRSQRFELDVYAYVLMGNHYHLLVRTHDANLSRAMQWLGVSYSSWHNARHHRIGHLFQGRFKSCLVPEPLRQSY